MRSPAVYIPDDWKVFDINSFCIPKHYEGAVDLLLPRGIVTDRIERIAREIALELGPRPLVALCVLKGGYKFFTELLDKVKDYVRFIGEGSVPISVDFIRIKSYKDDISEDVQITGNENLDVIKGKNVLIVEDLIDSGKTMKALIKHLEKYQPATVQVACLLVKRTPHYQDFVPDYCGFNVPDKFIVGYAIDYNEYFRDLNHVCTVNEEGKRIFGSKFQASKQSDAQQ